MVAGEHVAGSVASSRDPRITRVGRLLRFTSLDELPQIINVLLGQMSLVGPRPLLRETIKPVELRRLAVRPGITGLAAVHERRSLNWEQRMALDLWYVNHWSLLSDFRIVLRTIPLVFSGRDVSDPPRSSEDASLANQKNAADVRDERSRYVRIAQTLLGIGTTGKHG
jgi:lipopolysaccharide/colanic/teichoic acid biosynthesis glycosyltransferase